MSQIKEMARESQPDAGLHGDPPAPPRHPAVTNRLRALLDTRGKLVEQLAQVDRELARVRRDAAELACHEAALLRESVGDESFVVAVGDFVRGQAAPPAGVDREDFDRCLGKVLLALRRGGDPLSRTELEVCYQPRSGRIVSIMRRAGEQTGAERQLYRRFDLGRPAGAS